MLKKIAEVLLSLAVGAVLAQFIVLFYSNWYFGDHTALKIALLTPLTAIAYWGLLKTQWRRLWLFTGAYVLLNYSVNALLASSFDLRKLEFVQVLDYEAALVFVPLLAIWIYAAYRHFERERQRRGGRAAERRKLVLRRRLRKLSGGKSLAVTVVLLSSLPGPLLGEDSPSAAPVDRHTDLYAPPAVTEPAWPDYLPEPLTMRKRKYFYIGIENVQDGAIRVYDTGGRPIGDLYGAAVEERIAGRVLAPVSNINRKGFTASGWAPVGTVCASSVNAIHVKTAHNANDGRGVIFSLVPVEFATFDPKEYKSYFNQSSTLFTDIIAGEQIFGGNSAPSVGNKLLVSHDGRLESAQPAPSDYVPAVGDLLVLEVARVRFNPEYIEFENRFGGLIWMKEYELDAYPIGQVLRPVVGVGRFLGTQYAELGRIRAAHPGVIDISTTPLNSIGGFQIIPRDHAMSPEMGNTRYKTQWMVVGPLWALDPSWEGVPPLFAEYIYPAYTPLSREADWEDIYLNRFIAKARYSDAEDPAAYDDLHATSNLDNYALKNMTHLRIYFPIP